MSFLVETGINLDHYFQALDSAHQNAKEARKNAQEAQEKYADQASKVNY